MKAYGFSEYGGVEVQEWLDLPDPTPMGHEILVEVKAASVNPVDWKIREGYMREMMPLQLPTTMGREASGTVRALGKDVDGFTVGDEVFGTVSVGSGAYSELTVLPSTQTAKKPPNVSWTDAAAIPVGGGTAFDALAQLKLAEGQTLLINGIGGGVGVAAAQLARDLGVTVIGVGSENSRELSESLGATHFAYDGPDPAPLADQIRTILPDGVDAVLDLAGGDAMRAVAPIAKDPASVISTGDPVTVGELGGRFIVRNPSTETLTELARLVDTGKLDPHVTDVLAFDQTSEAIAAVEGGHPRGKVAVQVA
jgi:NADPH:quinone reductase-like Zn-dependent oxidoreductase